MSDKPVYLICVTSDNHNKYYNMFPCGSTFRVEYGRVDATKTEVTYPMSDWNKKYNEKIKKGYKDVTSLKMELVESVSAADTTKTRKQIECDSIRIVVDYLYKISRQLVDSNYKVSTAAVTQSMIDSAQETIDNLSTTNSITVFNAYLVELFSILPRKMSSVANYLATDTSDFAKIILREQDLLDALRGQVYIPSETVSDNEDNSEQTILEEFGLTMAECTDSEISLIKSLMGESADKFKKAWKVVNKETQRKFDDFIKKNGIRKTKLLFHGSRSENWMSIMKTGLKIRPSNVTTTGSMFGYGIYYAPKCQKSIGYTSLNGSYWSHGSSSTAYMALFDVAYGEPYDVYSFDPKYYDMTFDKLPSGKTCLHAHAGNGMLRNDEIIVYKEEQCTIKYLIEIGK